jgi:hypothetical protein
LAEAEAVEWLVRVIQKIGIEVENVVCGPMEAEEVDVALLQVVMVAVEAVAKILRVVMVAAKKLAVKAVVVEAAETKLEVEAVAEDMIPQEVVVEDVIQKVEEAEAARRAAALYDRWMVAEAEVMEVVE